MSVNARTTLSIALLLALCCSVSAVDITLGVLIPFTDLPIGQIVAGAVPLAVNDINNDLTILPDVHLSYSIHDDQCDVGHGFTALLSLMNDPTMHAIIGSGCSSVCEAVNMAVGFADIPQISWGCTSSALSDKSLYPNFVRTVPSWGDMGGTFLAILRLYGWQQVSVLATSDYMSLTTAVAVSDFLAANGITIQFLSTAAPSQPGDPGGLREPLLETFYHAGVRIVLLFLLRDDDIRDVMLTASDLDMIEGHVFMGPEIYGYQAYSNGTYWEGDGRDAEAVAAFQGLMSVTNFQPQNEAFDVFKTRVKASMTDNFGVVIPPDTVGNVYDAPSSYVYSAMMYDAIKLYSLGLHAALKQGLSVLNGSEITTMMYEQPFEGQSGHVELDSLGDRVPQFTLYTIVGIEMQRVGNLINDTFFPSNVTVAWPGGLTTPPPDSWPVLQFEIPAALSITLLVVGSGGMVFSAIAALLMCVFRNRPAVKATSPVFMCIVASGASMGYVYIFLWGWGSSAALCSARRWISHIGAGLMFGALFAKIYRIHRVFNSKSLQPLGKRLSDANLLRPVALVLVVELVVLSLASVMDPPRLFDISVGSGIQTMRVFRTCEASLWEGILTVIESCFVLLGSWWCWKTRGVEKRFNESRGVAVAIYNYLIVSALSTVLSVVFYMNPIGIVLVECGARYFSATPVFWCIFGPPVWDALFDRSKLPAVFSDSQEDSRIEQLRQTCVDLDKKLAAARQVYLTACAQSFDRASPEPSVSSTDLQRYQPLAG